MSRRTGSLRDMSQPTIADLDYHRQQVAQMATTIDDTITKMRRDIRRLAAIQITIIIVLLTR